MARDSHTETGTLLRSVQLTLVQRTVRASWYHVVCFQLNSNGGSWTGSGRSYPVEK